MHLVDNVDPVFTAGGGVVDLLPQVADIVYAVVGGGVDLYYIVDGAAVQPFTDLACVARLAVHSVGAVHRLGQDFGAGGFAGAAGAGKQIGVGNATLFDLVFQRGGHMVLAVHIGKDPRAVFTI